MTVNDLSSQTKNNYPAYVNAIAIGLSVFTFLFSIQLIGGSITSLGRDFADYAISATRNPFIGLFIGLLSTAILQSSSTTTTIAVAAVASGTLSLQGAIPIILGANIGTTLTSTIVAMGYITKSGEFRKAVSAGTVHDFFNILMVLILFPLESAYHILERASMTITSWIGVSSVETVGTSGLGFGSLFNGLNNWLISNLGAVVTLILAFSLLFYSIKFLSKLIYNLLIGRARDRFQTTVFKNTFLSFGWGLLLTSAIQSSSLTTSLIVPLVATSKVKLKRAFQFILGANIGTTITALLAATFQSEAAINLAIVHLLFNLIGVLIFLFIPFLRSLPVFLARKLGSFTLQLRIAGFAYILVAFFLIPFALIYFSSSLESNQVSMEISAED